MAKITKLKHSKTGEVLYPVTITDCILDSNGNPLGIGDNVTIPDNFTTNVSIKRLTQEEYDALTTKDSNTLYIIV